MVAAVVVPGFDPASISEDDGWVLAAVLTAVEDGSPVVRFRRRPDRWLITYEPAGADGEAAMVPFPRRVRVPRALRRLCGSGRTPERLRFAGEEVTLSLTWQAWLGLLARGRGEVQLKYGESASAAAGQARAAVVRAFPVPAAGKK